MGIRHLLSFVGYCILMVVINIIAIETQSQFVAIIFWLMIAITFFNIFRSISWGFHISDKEHWKGIIVRYFLNSFIPKDFFKEIAVEFRKDDNTREVPVVLFGIAIASYFIKQETEWTLFSVVFWITFIMSVFNYLLIYYNAGENELEDIVYDEPIGVFKILGGAISFWLFFIGVFGFQTIQNDTMPKYAEALLTMTKEYVINGFKPSTNYSGGYDDDDEEPYIRSHTGRE